MRRDAIAQTLLLDDYGELLTRKQRLYCDLYLNQDYSLSEIAQETGFFDTSYFIKTFKKYCGVTPLHFRRRSRREKQDPPR